MIEVLVIIDNKIRDLWGMQNLITCSKKKNIKIRLVSKFNWKLAIDTFDPEIVILPNAKSKDVGGKVFIDILEYINKKGIISVIFPSEGIDYSSRYLKRLFPIQSVKKATKFFLWSNKQGRVIKELGFKKKIVVTGTFRFENHKLKETKKKIKVIGFTSSGRYLASRWGRSSFHYISKIFNTPMGKINFTNEVNYFFVLIKIIEKLSKKNFKIIIKPHPFESPKIFKILEKFPNVYIDDTNDIRTFLKKIDILFNQESSACFDAIKMKIPVINMNKLIDCSKEYKKKVKDYLPSHIGIKVNDINKVESLLKKYDKTSLYMLNEKQKDHLKILKNCPSMDTSIIMANELLKLSKNKISKKNYLKLILFFIKEIYVIFYTRFSTGSDTLYSSLSLKDKKLVQQFEINKNN